MEWRAKKKAGGGTTDKPAAGGAAKKEEAGGFKELAKEDLLKMSMPEQLQYQKKFNEWKAEQKAKT